MSINSDLVIESSDFPDDILLSFLQSNSIANLNRAAQLACSLKREQMVIEQCREGTSGPMKDVHAVVCSQLADVFQDFSDIDIMWFRQFDSSKPIDHADSVFPVAYCLATAARSSAVAKGQGELERQAEAKLSGLKAPLAPVYRPKLLDVRHHSKRALNNLQLLRATLSREQNEHMAVPLLALNELAVSVVPFLRTLSSCTRSTESKNRMSYLPDSINARLAALSASQTDRRIGVKDAVAHRLDVSGTLDDDDITEFKD